MYDLSLVLLCQKIPFLETAFLHEIWYSYVSWDSSNIMTFDLRGHLEPKIIFWEFDFSSRFLGKSKIFEKSIYQLDTKTGKAIINNLILDSVPIDNYRVCYNLYTLFRFILCEVLNMVNILGKFLSLSLVGLNNKKIT